MAPIKLEDNMRDRLEERTIEPTAAAWDRISSKLEAEQGVKKSKRVLWMSIAASFVGGILIAILFFQNNTTSQGPSMVDTDANEKIEESIFIDPDEITTPNQEVIKEKEEVVVEEGTIKEVEEPLKNEKRSIVEKQNNTERIVQTSSKTKAIEKTIVKELPIEKEVVVASQEVEVKKPSEIIIDDKLNTIINQKIEEVVAQVESNESITDAEIEALLKNAQREIISKQIFNQKTNTVDANALLLDVEAEVAPLSFRNKVFEVIAEGYEKARDAVANRNN